MPTRIVFTGGAHLDVDTPILDLVALLAQQGTAGHFLTAVDSSLDRFVNADKIAFLEVVPESAEKPWWAERRGPRSTPNLGGFSSERRRGS